MSISGYPADNVSVDVSPASQVSPVMTAPAIRGNWCRAGPGSAGQEVVNITVTSGVIQS